MKKNIRFRKIAKFTLILIYLVIAAGAIVRMTGSGMGCPDWPKCFGYYIPPTEVETLQWQSERQFEEGQVIIKDEKLFVAKNSFETTESFEANNWAPYTKHDYAKFNVWHTWIEYINRLLGALAGLFTLILAIMSLSYWRSSRKITLISWFIVFAMIFQGWLGATVVYSVLEPVKITLHMLMALAIVALLLYVIHASNFEKNSAQYYQKPLITLLIITLGLSIAQIVLGTQVRQSVDDQIELLGYGGKSSWLQDPGLSFYIHRSFSILVVLVNGLLFWFIQKNKLEFIKIKWAVLLILFEIITGIAMYYFDFPFASQPIHLILASLLFGVQFYLILEALQSRKRSISL